MARREAFYENQTAYTAIQSQYERQSELMPRMRRKKCEEERIKAVNLKRIGKNKRYANSVLKLLR